MPGPRVGAGGWPLKDTAGDRYLEIWNLVFTQYLRGEGPARKDYPILRELPATNIDTGLGLERLATLLPGVNNLYEIDTSRPILDRAAELSGRAYGHMVTTMSRCGWSLTTSVPRSCSSAIG